MEKSVYDLIRQAIIEKKQVVAIYNGHQREMCPHVIGTKNGRQKALFYQFGGTSSSRPIVPVFKKKIGDAYQLRGFSTWRLEKESGILLRIILGHKHASKLLM